MSVSLSLVFFRVQVQVACVGDDDDNDNDTTTTGVLLCRCTTWLLLVSLFAVIPFPQITSMCLCLTGDQKDGMSVSY